MIPYDALRARAKAVLSPQAYTFYASGAGDQQTVAEAEAAWRDIRLRPRVLRDVRDVTTTTTLLGTQVAAPVVVAPTAAHAFAHVDAEPATAAGARDAGSLLVLSTRSSSRLDDVAAAAGPWWMQLYVMQDRGLSDEIARRSVAAGASALVVTVDTPRIALKPYGHAPAFPGQPLLPELDHADRAAIAQAADVTAAELSRLGDIAGVPVVAKGVLRADDARACVDAGAAAVVVSTHGGRQLDGVVPTPRALPEVVTAIGDQVEVHVDGGVRTGRDVLRALALGARAAWVGRPALWALAVGGAGGVRTLLDDLRADVAEALALAGCTSVEDVGSDLVWQPRQAGTVDT
ncbi:MAG: alpha-hydroxy acid oxidase [Jiangellaceae bacterium]